MDDDIRAEYMFGLLGYSTWNLYHDRTFVAQVTLNEVDRSVTLTFDPGWPHRDATLTRMDWRHWMQWLRRHRHIPL